MTKLHPQAPWGEITFAGAYWNCAPRLEKLLEHVRPWFRRVAVIVQDSPDNTLEVARKYADIVLEDRWHGRGDPSISTLISSIERHRWAFVISDDEWPTEELLHSFQGATEEMVKQGSFGAWVHFKSTIDGFDFTREQDEHLRLFQPRIGWPSMPHARPPVSNGIKWRPDPESFVRHDRSLDEMMQDYVRRYDLTGLNPQWQQQQAHNVRMIAGACNAIAERTGWPGIKEFDWWPRVLEIAYDGKDPDPVEPKAAAAELPVATGKRKPKKA